MTIDQLIYAILGGAGFGVFIAAISRWLLRGWGRPQPLLPPSPPTPTDNRTREGPTSVDPVTQVEVELLAVELAKEVEQIKRDANEAARHAIVVAKQEALKAMAARRPKPRPGP